MTKDKLFTIAGHPIDGFHLDDDFFNRVIDRVEDETIIPDDPDTMAIVHTIIATSIAEFMDTFEVKKQ